MICKAILRKSERAGCQCTNAAKRDGWCRVHDPLIVVPRLEKKRDHLESALRRVELEIAAYKPDDPIENAS